MFPKHAIVIEFHFSIDFILHVVPQLTNVIHTCNSIVLQVSFPFSILIQGQTLDSHDYVFWCGDLNYRIELPTQIAKDHITNARWSNLMKHDQLKKQKKLRKVFLKTYSDTCFSLSLSTTDILLNH